MFLRLPILQKETRAHNTHSSTAIEGNPLTLAQVKAIDRGEETGTPQKYEQEVSNYLKAMRWIEKNSQKQITEKILLKLHKTIMGGLLPGPKPGRYKEKQNYIVNEKNIKIYSPPSPEQTPKLTKHLLAWLNSKDTQELHSIITCAILHYQLASIHPFSDGNGRIARLLGTYVLYQKGFDNQHIFSLDDFFAGNRKMYYLKLEQARELDEDITAWIEYVAEGVVQTLRKVKKRIEDLQVESQAQISITPRQEDILRLLRDNPALRGNELTKQLKISRARLNQIITPLIKNDLVIKEGKRRATRYRLKL
ncbi:Fic family protein [Candidatus Margulisiibacteriota bacterium]